MTPEQQALTTLALLIFGCFALLWTWFVRRTKTSLIVGIDPQARTIEVRRLKPRDGRATWKGKPHREIPLVGEFAFRGAYLADVTTGKCLNVLPDDQILDDDGKTLYQATKDTRALQVRLATGLNLDKIATYAFIAFAIVVVGLGVAIYYSVKAANSAGVG